MIILAIDTSCDDTCVSILKLVNGRFKILSNVVSSQVKLHAKYGGVYPSLAKREHKKNLPLVLEKAIKKAKNPKINLIAVTVGPGLEPCLWVGVNFTKELAKKENLPIVPVNHIEAHILANWLQPIGSQSKFLTSKSQNVFPAICLVVSGGHTQLILMKDIGKYRVLGETRDDAAGECFDKIARILGLGYPGGPAIETYASKLDRGPASISLPRPMMHQKNYDFSFSGLKTAVLYKVKSMKPKEVRKKEFIRAMAAEVQQAIIDVLIHKTVTAAKGYKAKSIILGGGVVANQQLRKQFKLKIQRELPRAKFFVPDSKFSTDNAAMIAVTGYYQWLREGSAKIKSIEAKANLRL